MTKRIKAFFRKKGADKPIFFAVFVLICLGIVMIGSASIGVVSSKGTAFAIKNMITQSINEAIGVFIMMVLTKVFKLKKINYRSSMAVYIMGIISMCGCVFWTNRVLLRQGQTQNVIAALFEQAVQKAGFTSCVRVIAQRYFHLRCAAHYTAVVRKCFVAFFAVILSHTGTADTAEAGMRAC